jgi:hypothetical protein
VNQDYKERDIEKHLVKRVKELGGEVRKVQWVGRRGAPDRLVMLRMGRDRFGDTEQNSVWVELKAPGGAETFPANAHERQQAREHTRMARMGQRVVIIDSIEAVDRLLA